MNVESQYIEADLLNSKRYITVLAAITIQHEGMSPVPWSVVECAARLWKYIKTHKGAPSHAET